MRLDGLGEVEQRCFLSEKFRNCYASAEADVRSDSWNEWYCSVPNQWTQEKSDACWDERIYDKLMEMNCLQFCYDPEIDKLAQPPLPPPEISSPPKILGMNKNTALIVGAAVVALIVFKRKKP